MENKEQELAFRSEELLTPSMIRKRYGFRIIGSGKQRLYTIDEVLELKKERELKGKGTPNYSSANPCANCSLEGKKQVKSAGDLRTAKVVFVGQAPGRNEEEQGIPFVGRAGKLLHDTLEELEFDEEELAFANVCRCSPPGDRSPTKEEVQCCMRYLSFEIAKVTGLVVLLGAVPLKALVGKSGIGAHRGYGFFKGGKKFLATYHPSFILRTRERVPSGETGQVEVAFRGDLLKVKKYIDKKPEIPYNKVLSIKELGEFTSSLDTHLKEKGEIRLSFDIETTGLDPLDKETEILSIAFSTGDETWAIPLSHPESPFRENIEEVITVLRPYFNDGATKLVGQGAKFDIRFLTKKYGMDITNFWFDTQIAHFLIEGKNVIHKLKSCAWRYTDYGGYDVDTENLKKTPLDEVLKYNAMDAFVQYKLMEIYSEEMSEKQRDLMTKTIGPAVLAISEMENSGVKVDEENLEKFTVEYTEALIEIETQMHSYPEVVALEAKNQKLLNFNSGDQIRELLIELGLEPKKRTKKRGVASTDEEALEQVEEGHPVVRDILKYRKKDKILGSYLKSYKKKMDEKSVVHGDYGFIRTVTGRLACERPNFQNVPYGVRPVFKAKHDWLVEVDYSQLELRVLAMYSKDEALVQAFNEGKDIHEETRQAIFGDATGLSKAKKTKQRVEAKSVNFGIVYLISAYGLAKGLKISRVKAQGMIDSHHKLHPKVQVYVEDMKRSAKRLGYVETFFGRRRYFRFTPDLPEQRIAGMYREAVNAPIQSAASDLVITATGKIWKAMRLLGMKSRLIANVHDSVLFDVFDDELEPLLEMIRPLMEDLPFDWINVPLQVDISIGTHWGELEEL